MAMQENAFLKKKPIRTRSKKGPDIAQNKFEQSLRELVRNGVGFKSCGMQDGAPYPWDEEVLVPNKRDIPPKRYGTFMRLAYGYYKGRWFEELKPRLRLHSTLVLKEEREDVKTFCADFHLKRDKRWHVHCRSCHRYGGGAFHNHGRKPKKRYDRESIKDLHGACPCYTCQYDRTGEADYDYLYSEQTEDEYDFWAEDYQDILDSFDQFEETEEIRRRLNLALYGPYY